jgi:ABC transport system ATP-binding/permease protein
MALISLQQAQLAFGHVPLLDHCDFAVEAHERVGLVGRNGSGKSSLLRILAGQEKPDDGELQYTGGLRLAFVPQEPDFASGSRVFDLVSAGLARAREVRDLYLAALEHPEAHPGADTSALQNEIEVLDAWNWENRVTATLAKLELDGDAVVDALSGGMRKRVALAQGLVSRPDVLLLDEPTNHLDLDAITWLEDLLLEFPGSVVVISHDRAFLDRVVTRVVELDRGQLSSYDGNFSRYQVLKEERLAQEEVINAKADKLLAQEEVWIRKGVEARRTRAQARIERLKRLREQRASRRDVVGRVKLEVDSGARSGKLVAELEKVCKHFGSGDARKVIVDNFTATILRGDKVGLIGPNGAGKTTLLKLILGTLAPDSGSVTQGTQLQVAYFDQMRDQLDLEATLEDFISPGSEWIEIAGRRTHVKSYLADFLFSPARAHAPVKTLSGGERNRLLLARLFARPANVLVLDEPTNDLDIDTLELLEDLLADYKGTVFLVSHDRRFLDNVVTSTIVFEGAGQWREYEGDVQDWLTQSARAASLRDANAKRAGAGQSTAQAANPPAKASSAQQGGTGTPPERGQTADQPTSQAAEAGKPRRKLSYKEQRELDALPGQMEALEKEQADIDKAMAGGALYGTDPARAAQLAARHAEIDEALLAALERWEALSA